MVLVTLVESWLDSHQGARHERSTFTAGGAKFGQILLGGIAHRAADSS